MDEGHEMQTRNTDFETTSMEPIKKYPVEMTGTVFVNKGKRMHLHAYFLCNKDESDNCSCLFFIGHSLTHL